MKRAESDSETSWKAYIWPWSYEKSRVRFRNIVESSYLRE